MNKGNILEDAVIMKNITKAFPGVVALNGVSFSVKKGEVRGLVGENVLGSLLLLTY